MTEDSFRRMIEVRVEPEYLRRFVLVPLLVTLLGVGIFGSGTPAGASTYDTAQVTVTSETGLRRGTITAKIADSPRERYVGLRGVTELDTNAGMLFVYPASHERNFTMRGVEIPLDIMFVDRTGRIRSIHSVEPGVEDVRSEIPVRYVLETNAGWTRRRGVRVGDYLRTKD